MIIVLSLPWLVSAPPVSSQAPETDQNEAWLVRESKHFRFHFLPDSAAARDIVLIIMEAEDSLGRLSRLEIDYEKQFDVYLVERVFWQGGAAYGEREILLSYLDRNYANVPLNYYLDHEFTHILAYSLVPRDGKTNTLLAEGLATWATGGHYGPEPIHLMAAALPLMERYIPLERLLTDFRQEQHEISYIESASFVGWLVEAYGLHTALAFYGAADEPEAFFEMDYAALEEAWLRWLEAEHDSQEVAATALWWETQIRFFDQMRDYQQTFDVFSRELPEFPSAWPPSKQEKYQQNKDEPLNIALETQLIAASEALNRKEGQRLSNNLLDEIEEAISQEAIISEPMLERRLEIASLLSDYNLALERIGGAALFSMATLDWQGNVARQLFKISQLGAVRQEIAKIYLEEEQTVVFVAFYSLEGANKTATYKLTFKNDKDWWRLSDISPIPSQQLIARRNR